MGFFIPTGSHCSMLPGKNQTPENDPIPRMVAYADTQPKQIILVASTGVHDILKLLDDTTLNFYCEYARDLIGRTTTDTSWSLMPVPFDDLTQTSLLFLGELDRIIMIPPTENSTPMRQVVAAWKLLKSGGVLVAMLPSALQDRADSRGRAFTGWLEGRGQNFFDPTPDGVILVLHKE